jgi:hypothetical protein
MIGRRDLRFASTYEVGFLYCCNSTRSPGLREDNFTFRDCDIYIIRTDVTKNGPSYSARRLRARAGLAPSAKSHSGRAGPAKFLLRQLVLEVLPRRVGWHISASLRRPYPWAWCACMIGRMCPTSMISLPCTPRPDLGVGRRRGTPPGSDVRGRGADVITADGYPASRRRRRRIRRRWRSSTRT